MREQVRLTLGGGQTRLHVREAQLLAGADGPQRTDHEAAWKLNEGVGSATMRDAGSSSPRGEGKRRAGGIFDLAARPGDQKMVA